MHKIIGKLNRKVEKTCDYRRILELEDNVFDIKFSELELIEFNPDTLLDEESWFFIKEFKEREFFLNILKSPLSTANYNNLKQKEVHDLHYILIENSSHVYIQKVTPSLILKNKFLYIRESYKVADNEEILMFKNIPDAIYDKDADKLYFKRIATLNSIFPGIEELYREATDDEIGQFLEGGFITLTKAYQVEDIKSSNRKRILMLNDILKTLEKSKLKELLDYTYKYCPTLPFDSDIFTIANERELKDLLYGLQERYYTTIVGGEERIANSIIVL